MHINENTVKIASALGRRGYAVTSVEIHTPDGRKWAIDTTSGGGFRLYEIDPSGVHEPEEHDADDGIWTAGDLIDYLAAVGAARR